MQRIKTLDLARGFTVLMIAPIHTMLLYSKLEVREMLLGNLLRFVAEWHGAQIFMLIMGISFSFSKKREFKPVLERATLLLGIAYALNIFKFVVLHFFGLLPQPLLDELQIQNEWFGYVQLFLIGDILHFASIALIYLYLIKKQKHFQWAAISLALIFCFVAPFFWDKRSEYFLVDYYFQLMGGQPPQIFFPFFPWIVYPLVGLSIGYWMQRTGHQKVFWLIRDIGWMLILFSLIIKYFIDQDFSLFYRTKALDTILHLGFAMVALSVWDWISENVRANHLFRLLTYLSENITQVYIIEWLIIFWMLPLFGYQQLGFSASVFCILLTSFITLGISLSISAYGKKNI